MKCREAVHIANTQQFNGLMHRVRYYAHLLACAACVRYVRLSKTISNILHSYLQTEVRSYQIDSLNEELVKKLSIPKK